MCRRERGEHRVEIVLTHRHEHAVERSMRIEHVAATQAQDARAPRLEQRAEERSELPLADDGDLARRPAARVLGHQTSAPRIVTVYVFSSAVSTSTSPPRKSLSVSICVVRCALGSVVEITPPRPIAIGRSS